MFSKGADEFFFPPKNFFLLVLNTIQVEPGALRAPGRGPPAELSRLTVFRETQQVRNSRYEILENKAWRSVCMAAGVGASSMAASGWRPRSSLHHAL